MIAVVFDLVYRHATPTNTTQQKSSGSAQSKTLPIASKSPEKSASNSQPVTGGETSPSTPVASNSPPQTSPSTPVASNFPLTSWNTSLSNVIHADVTQSVTLTSGNILWIFGDTDQVNGTSTITKTGYPHNAFVLQKAGTLTFTAQSGSYGYGWQQVPNWSSDGSYFWGTTPIVDNGTLYILGNRVKGTNPFSIVGPYMAMFNASTLSYEGIIPIPGGSTGTTAWGGVIIASSGYWLTGTHPVSCSNSTDCREGDMAFVSFGNLADTSSWQVYNNIISSSYNLGKTLAPIQISSGWELFTKKGDSDGSNSIESLVSTSMLGAWSLDQTWNAPYPPGTVTYGVAVHLEQASPAGQVLVSYNVNGVNSDYFATFTYLPIY